MEITLYNQIQNPLDAIDRLGEWFAKSGMTGADNINTGKILAWECMAQKKSPTQILKRYDIINGKLKDKAISIYADFRALGGKVEWLSAMNDANAARAKFIFEGQTISAEFTIEMAQKQGLIRPNSGWTKNPSNMLRARLLTNAIAMLAPEITAGDDDNEASTVAPTITLTPPAPTPVEVQTAAPVATPPVIEVDEVPMSYPTKAVTPTPPVAVAAPQAKVEAAPASQTAVAPAGLPDEMVGRLEAAIGEHGMAAGKWLVKEGWLKAGEGLAQLSEARANRILKQTASFLRAVTGSAN